MPDISSSLFWIAVLQIIAIDIMLGGDNAVVIALACRKLPPEQRKKGIFWGVVGAIGLRVVMIFFALQLLALPYLKIVGALLLLWIGIKLLLPEHDDEHGNAIEGGTTLLAAIKTVVVADAVMSLDNVIAVAGASHGSMVLVTFGILVSIPIVVWGSKLVLAMMDRFPLVITLGAALLGWIAGGLIIGDPIARPVLPESAALHYAASAVGAALVVIVGRWLASRRAATGSAAPAVTMSGKRSSSLRMICAPKTMNGTLTSRPKMISPVRWLGSACSAAPAMAITLSSDMTKSATMIVLIAASSLSLACSLSCP